MEKRRLAAIVFSDIYDFTGKIGRNEDLMMDLLSEHNRLFEWSVEAHGGRIVKSIGDGFMMEFSSAPLAVKSCLAIQKLLAESKFAQERGETLQVRFGINIGEIIERGDDIFGAVVNIASRLEGQAEPGGICLSNAVVNSVRAAMQIDFVPLGPLQLKHVADPIDAFAITAQWIRENVLSPAFGQSELERPKTRITPSVADEEDDTGPITLAVMPFRVIGAKAEDRYIGESLVDALVFALSRENQIHVHPTESLIALGDNATNPDKIFSSLGVGYLVRGVIHIAGIRLTVQISLIKAKSQINLLSEEFKGTTDEIFRLQKIIAQAVLFATMQQVSDETQASLSAAAPNSPMAGKFFLDGVAALRRAVTWVDYKQAVSLLQRAVMLDPNLVPARTELAGAYAMVHGQWQNDKSWLDKALSEAKIAQELDPTSPEVESALGKIHLLRGNVNEAEGHLLNAIGMRPQALGPKLSLSELYYRQGRLAEANALLNEAQSGYRSRKDCYSQAKIALQLGRLAMTQGMLLKSLESYDMARRLSETIGNDQMTAQVRLSLGVVYRSMGKLPLARDNYNQANAIFERLGDKKSLAGGINNLAILHEAMGETKNAVENYLQSVRISEEVGDDLTLAAALTGLGKIYSLTGKMPEAVEYLSRAIDLRRQQGDRMKEAIALIDLAATYCDAGRRDDSLHTYQQVYDLVVDTGNKPMLANVLLNIGEIREFDGDFQSAIESYDQAERVFAQFDQNQYKPYLHLFRGRTFLMIGDIARALSDLVGILDETEVRPSVALRAQIYHSFCQTGKESSDDWRPNVTAAIEKLIGLGSYPEIVEVHRALGWFHLSRAEFDQARKILQAGHEFARLGKMDWEIERILRLLQSCER